MDYIAIDSYGSRLQNKELPGNLSAKLPKASFLFHLYDEELMSFLAQYKFIIAIENAVCKDYVTEKLWRAIELGVVPIYYGSPLIRDWLPNNKSAILLEDFPTPELLSQHLHYLLNNDTAYEEYLEHKTLGLISNTNAIKEAIARPYQLDLNRASDKFECFICEKLHDKDGKVNMVAKKDFDCSLPTSALTLKVNPNSSMLIDIEEAKVKLDEFIDEMNNSSNKEPRSSDTSFVSAEMFLRMIAIETIHEQDVQLSNFPGIS
ncbi:alpha-(1,3)-fucosyltransferase B-like [Pectinophora gossypiella]|uniref:alpha-(1,3)-fucosyltransferase B-like n=1 Tax=Pectinophora gossypiella TaxID=13191 RepID=UPI00214E355B|nr:alpha-(1,3)-fucosyltransferase B-like [Pectinophora gossypiella]